MQTFTLPPLYYDDFCVFKSLSLTLKPGFTALIGPSGVGKTSLLHSLSQHAENLALMMQDDPLIVWMNNLENVYMGDILRGTKPNLEKAQRLLKDFGLSNSAKDYPSSLSGGMKQRLALARTLYEERPLVLLDEPFSKLDAASKKNALQQTRHYLKKAHVLFVSHDLQDVLSLADHILILKGSPATLTPLTKDTLEKMSLHAFREIMA